MATWDDHQEPASDAAIDAVEVLLGIRFPADLRACLRDHHGGTLRERSFLVPSAAFQYASAANLLLSLDPRDSEGLFATLGLLSQDDFPPTLVPLFADGGGDYVCYDSDPATSRSIVYWEHETGSVVPLAASFSDFLAQLRPAR